MKISHTISIARGEQSSSCCRSALNAERPLGLAMPSLVDGGGPPSAAKRQKSGREGESTCAGTNNEVGGSIGASSSSNREQTSPNPSTASPPRAMPAPTRRGAERGSGGARMGARVATVGERETRLQSGAQLLLMQRARLGGRSCSGAINKVVPAPSRRGGRGRRFGKKPLRMHRRIELKN